MKINGLNEKECRELNIPYFDSIEELKEFIESLDTLNNDYGTAAYSMSLAGVAAFNYIAHRFGCTGFQAGYADLDMIRRIRLIKGPFMIIDLENYLYPQYNLQERLNEFIKESNDWIIEQAKNNLKENPGAHPNVINHWKKLAKEES